VVGRTEEERVARLIERLATRLDRPSAEAGPRVLLVVDGLAAWRQAVAERLGPELADRLDRVLVEGPARGVVAAATIDRPTALPLAVAGAAGTRLVFRLADPADAVSVGLRPGTVADLPRGRAVLADRGLEVQLAAPADPGEAVARLARAWPKDSSTLAPPLHTLPCRIAVGDLPPATLASTTPVPSIPSGEVPTMWSLPIGLDGRTLDVHTVGLHPGEHLLVAGPPRSGRSTALAVIATQVLAADPRARVVAVTPRRSPLRSVAGIEHLSCVHDVADLPSMGPDATTNNERMLLVVDDAELIDDTSLMLQRVVSGACGEVSIVAAGRIDALRSAYGHWTQPLRRLRRGVLLRPGTDVDGDVLGVVLPRREVVPAATGRGYVVVDASCALVQLARYDPVANGAAE
jgi:S-DNA-T family DNA segregation ATPase FtsK/SpoIIIE